MGGGGGGCVHAPVWFWGGGNLFNKFLKPRGAGWFTTELKLGLEVLHVQGWQGR
jgi:hypothetical protein